MSDILAPRKRNMLSSKIVHITTVHPSTDARIFVKECRSLYHEGYDTVLIARHEGPASVDGLSIRALKPARNRFGRMFWTGLRALCLSLKEKACIYHFHDPEFIPYAILLKLLGKKVIYDVHEDLPRQMMDKLWMPKYVRFLASALAAFTEWFGALFFDAIVAATPHIAQRFPENKTIIVQNFPIIEEFEHTNAMPYSSRPNLIAYIGIFAKKRGIEEMVQAVSIVAQHRDARLVLGGFFSPADLQKKMQDKPGWKQVDERGYLSRQGVLNILNQSKIGLTTLHPTPAYVKSYPVKMFEYMAARLPIIASDFPLWKEIVGDSGCALFVDPTDPRAIAEAIDRLLSHPEEAEAMGRRGRDLVINRYNWRNEEIKLLALYGRLVPVATLKKQTLAL